MAKQNKTILLVAIGLILSAVVTDWWRTRPPGLEREYVGTGRCIECHQRQGNGWDGSDHHRAMDRATSDTVLGDFNSATVEHFGVESRMSRDGSRFLVNTEGPDGEWGDFEVKYVFGHEPLQQYLVEMHACADSADGQLGKLQVLPFCWDTQAEQWFYLSPPDVDERMSPDDPLHWTSYGQNWNHMCARCHSTDLVKNFDLDDACYRTTFAEISVGCEACHGPGSLHVELAEAKSLFWDRRYGKAIQKFSSLQPQVEMQTCAPCHSRSRQVYPGFEPGDNYYDHFVNELLTSQTYYPDGQIRDEVYVFGSYMQSKMFSKGVRCSDCHDPHTAQLKHEGNRLCTSCHQHPEAKYDTPAHHQHRVGSKGAQCVECHMPERSYMQVDWRRDHGMQIPRPSLSLELGTPNACVGCHLNDQMPADVRGQFTRYQDWLEAAEQGNADAVSQLSRLNQWATDAARKWWGDPPEGWQPGVARALSAGWEGDTDAAQDLSRFANDRRLPGMIRASALMTLAELSPSLAVAPSRRALGDRSAQVRRAGCLVSSQLPRAERATRLTDMLDDPVRCIRFEAAIGLADIRDVGFSPSQRAARELAMEEYHDGVLAESDQPGSHMALAMLAERTGNLAAARRAYENAIRVQPEFTGPRTNLAALLDRMGDAEAATKYRRAELPLLERDVRLVPDNAFLQYRYGLALHLAERSEEAEQALVRAHELDSDFLECTYFLALYYMQSDRTDQARELASDLIKRAPNEPRFRDLVERLSAR